jgi:Flp pilus assembly protein TadG
MTPAAGNCLGHGGLPIFRRLLADRSGIAATEFALTLPLLAALWLGMAELTQISMAGAKATLAAQSVADLVSRYSSGGYSDPQGFTDLEAAAATIIAPLPTTSGNPLVSIVSATLNSSGAPTEAWQCTTGTMPPSYSVTTLLSAAPALTTQNSALGSVIMVTVFYVYSPTISGGITGSQTFSATAYSIPRTVSAIPKPC